MSSSYENIEKEAKFYIRDLKKAANTIRKLGGKCTQPRVLESNMRFDTTDRRLSTTFQVLRLRQDTRTRLTYKGPADPSSAVSTRSEIEVEISDLAAGQRILEALEYELITVYEKYRTSYELKGVEVSLDEMPFGDFIEIEGLEVEHIKRAAELLSLDWERRTSLSYLRIFTNAKEQLGLSMRDLTFRDFTEVEILPAHLQLEFAD